MRQGDRQRQTERRLEGRVNKQGKKQNKVTKDKQEKNKIIKPNKRLQSQGHVKYGLPL